MGNEKEQTLNKSTHGGSMTNKVSLWTGVVATAKTTGWSTISVSSTAKSANSLSKHPSVSTYGWTVVAMSQAVIWDTARVGYLSSTDNTK